jgi:peptide/nickel transport system substrate-binding protein
MMRRFLFCVTLFCCPAIAQADCPEVTVANNMGLSGQFPQQFELAEFETAANCKLTFSENPQIGQLNARIVGNPTELPPVENRLPEEPLVVAPYNEIGQYGGVFDGIGTMTSPI